MSTRKFPTLSAEDIAKGRLVFELAKECAAGVFGVALDRFTAQSKRADGPTLNHWRMAVYYIVAETLDPQWREPVSIRLTTAANLAEISGQGYFGVRHYVQMVHSKLNQGTGGLATIEFCEKVAASKALMAQRQTENLARIAL